MELYLYEDYKEMYPEARGRELTDILILETLKNCGFPDAVIQRTEKGRPYTERTDGETVHFSVSHSGRYFACLVGSEPVGVDIQQYRRVRAAAIADRYFTDEEKRLIDENGEDGFFTLWARKEAYCKYTGRGLEQIIGGVSVLDRDDVEFIDFQPEKGMYCSCCIMKLTEKKDI